MPRPKSKIVNPCAQALAWLDRDGSGLGWLIGGGFLTLATLVTVAHLFMPN